MVSDFTIELLPPVRIKDRRFVIGTIKRSLPFWQKEPGRYVHRARSGRVYQLGERQPHTAFQMWCGMCGFISHNKDGRLLAAPPPGEVCCAICEGKATGAGLNGTPIIAGLPVRYSPRY